MKRNQKSQYLNLLKRSFVVFIVCGLILMANVNFEILNKTRLIFLEGIFKDGDYANYNDCIHFYETLIRLCPAKASDYRDLGVCYFQMKEYNLAISSYLKALELDPNNIRFKQELQRINK